MRPFVLNWSRRGSFPKCVAYCCSSSSTKEVVAPPTGTLRIKNLAADGTAIHKVSLSRGLVMNKFEKDFMIYPEYTDTDDVRSIQGYTDVLKKSLALTVDRKELEKFGSLTDDIRSALNDSTIYAALSPSAFGGMDLGFKDRTRIFEELSVDWNIFANVGAVSTLVNILLMFGSEEMKEKYFPLINAGKCRPIIALLNDLSVSSNSEIVGSDRTHFHLCIENMRCIGMHNSNLAVLFARSTQLGTKEKYYSCYILDRSELKETDKWEFKRDDTLGLKAFDVGSLNISASLTENHLVGKLGQGMEEPVEILKDELESSGCLPLAAATVGYAKRLLNDLAAICNKTPSPLKENAVMSDEPSLQHAATEFALKAYILESASYYLAGLLDERFPVVLDIENSLIHKLTRDVLRSSITISVDLAGLRAINPLFHFEKDIRDVTTLLTLNRAGSTVESVAIAALSSWSSVGQKRRVVRIDQFFSFVRSLINELFIRITNSLKRLFRHEKLEDELRNPKLTHYIAEHAHPSLTMACQDLEFSISRINNVISKLLAETGKNVQHDFAVLDQLVTVIQNHLVMVAVISRASRSYSIGLRNSDVEIAWATFICSRASRENWFLLEALNDLFGLVRNNPSLLNVGRFVFDKGGYQIESPIEKNW